MPAAEKVAGKKNEIWKAEVGRQVGGQAHTGARSDPRPALVLDPNAGI